MAKERMWDGTRGAFHQRSIQQFVSNKVDLQPSSKLRMNMSWIWNPSRTTGALPGYAGTDAPDNPWGGTTLEWQTSSPPITHNFEDQPVLEHEPYDYRPKAVAH